METINSLHTINTISMYVLILINAVVIFVPRFFIQPKEALTGQILKELYPQKSWVRWGFSLVFFGWLGLIIFVVFVYELISIENHWLLSTLNAFAAMGIFYGLFSILTGFIMVPIRQINLRFSTLYATGSRAFQAAKLQIAISISAIIINSIIQFILTR